MMHTAFTPSPSFRDSATAAAAAADESRMSSASGDGPLHWISAVVEELNRPTTDNGLNDEFEFTFSPADEIFSDGRILPLFNSGSDAAAEKAVSVALRDLLNAEREAYSRSGTMSSPFSSVDDLDGVPQSVPPSPERWWKSRSTGSASRRWRIRDLVFGRSRSDGKDRLGLASQKVAPEMEKRAYSSPGREARKAVGKKGKDMVTAYKLYYAGWWR